MATNLTLAAADRNFDSTDASVLTDGGTIAVNNNYTLRIDSDTGYCRNAATPLSLTLNATSGGKTIIDGRDVWWVPYSAATGNVPAFTVFNDLTAPADVQRSGLDVGAWLGFYSAMGVPPVLPGNAIPATGFLKLRYKTTTFTNGDVLTFTGGSTVTLSGAGQRGWISVQMEGISGTNNTITLPRLGDFRCEGDFFELGETKSEAQVNGTDINATNNKIYFRQNGTNNYYIGTIATGNYASAAAFATAVQTAINGAVTMTGTSGAFPGTCTVTAGADDRLTFTFSASAFRFVGVGPICAAILGFDYFDQSSAIQCLTATGAGTGSTSASANQLRVIRSGVGHTLTLTNSIAAGSAVAAEVNTRLRTLDPRFYCIWDGTNSRVNIHHPEAFTIDFTIANHPGTVMGYASSSLSSAVIHRVIGRTNVATTGNTTSRAAANYLIGINDGADKLVDIGNNTSVTNTALATAVQTALNAASSGFSAYIAVAAGGPLVIARSSAFTLKWSLAKINSASRALGFNNDDSNDLTTQTANSPYNFGAQNQTLNYFIKDVCPGIQVETAVGSGVYEWYAYVPRAPTSFYYNINSSFSTTGRWANTTRTVVGTPTTVPTDTRGKYFSMLTTGSGLTIAGAASTESHQIVLGFTDGINDCGYVPRVAGCKIRVPNIHLGSGYGRVISTFGFTQAADTTLATSTTAPGAVSNYVVATASFNNYFPFRENDTDKMAVIAAATYTSTSLPTTLALALNLASNGFNTYSVSITTNIITITASQPFSINYLSNKAYIVLAAAASRPEFVTTSAGSMSMKKCASHWYLNLSAPFSVLVEDTSTLQNVNIANVANTTALTRVCVSPTYTDSVALSIASCFTGGTISDSMFVRYLFVTPHIQLTDSSNFTISGTTVKSFGLTAIDARRATNTTATTVDGIAVNRCADTVISACKLLYGRVNVASAIRTTVLNHIYADSSLTNISANGPGNIYNIGGNSDTIYLEGLSSWDNNPYTWCYNDLVLAANYSNFTMRNMGTATVPLNMYSMTSSFFSGSIGVNTDVRRIYLDNMRGNTPIVLANTLQNVNLVNLWGPPASNAFGTNNANGIDSVNNNVQGCRWTLGTSGQVACYGFHWTDFFVSTISGRVLVLCNEPLSSTTSQCAVTAGTPAFNSNGSVAMPTLGDQITWTCPYYVLGYTAFTNSAIGFTQSGANYTYEYQIDPGTGVYGIYKSLTQANLITETITATTGFKLRIRATTAVANAANTITAIQITMTTDATAQREQYPLPLTGTGTITSMIAGSRVQVYNETKALELVNTVVGSTSYTYSYDPAVSASADDTIRLRITRLGYLPYQARTIAAAASFGFLAEQLVDAIYTTNAVDGSTVAECTADFLNDKIDIDDPDDTTTVQRIYAYYRYAETLSAGIGDWFNAVLAVNTSTYVVSQSVLDLTYRNASVDPLRITGGRWTRADNSTMKYSGTNPIWTESVTVSGLQAGSTLQIWNSTTSAELYNAVVGGTSYQFDFSIGTGISTGNTLRIRVGLLGYLPFTTSGAATATETLFTASQVVDNIYTTNAVDGASVPECTANYADDTIEINDSDDTTSVQRIYAFFRSSEASVAGIGDWFGAVTANSVSSYTINVGTVDLFWDNTKVAGVVITGGRWDRSNATSIAFTGSNPILMEVGSITSIVAGSRIQIYNVTTATEIINTTVGGTSYTITYADGTGITAGDSVRIRLTRLGQLPYQSTVAATLSGFSLTAAQLADAIYATNAIDGSTVAECTADYGNNTIDINDADDSTSIQRIYAFYRYAETTSGGIAAWHAGINAIDTVTYQILVGNVNLTLDNTKVAALSLTNGGGRITRSNGSSYIFATSNAIQMEWGVISSILDGSRLQIYNTTTATQLVNAVVSGTSYAYNYNNGTGITTGDTIRIRLTLLGQLPYQSTVAATSSGFSLTAAQLADAIYTTNAIDGSTVTECSADYGDNTIDINDPDDSTSIQRIYAFFRSAETTSTGIASWYAGINAIDTVTYQIMVGNVNLTLDNIKVAALSLTISGGRITRSNGSSYIFATSNAIRMEWGVISSILNGSRLQIYNTTTATQLVNAVVSGTSYAYNYNNGTEITTGDSIRIRLTLVGRLPYQASVVASSSGFALTADQSALDTIYTANAITGSTVSECAADYINDKIDITDGDNVTQVQRIYAWYRYNETTDSGIANWFNVLSAVDATNYVVAVPTLDLTINNVNATPLRVTNARLYRSDGSTVIYATSNSIQMDPDKVYAIATGGSALTVTENAVLMSLSGLKPLVIAGL
jgi:hypothetical protein